MKASILVFSYLFLLVLAAQAKDSGFEKHYELTGVKSKTSQHFSMRTEIKTFGIDGKLQSTESLDLNLRCTPKQTAGRDGDQYTCQTFAVTYADGRRVTIPALEGWTYVFRGGMENGQTLGIDHNRFQNLTDNNGASLPPDKNYFVYNAFIDFHAFCNVFADEADNGKGIQDLSEIGQKVIHAAANSEAPVNLGSTVAEGSFFRNGEITLEFKGLSKVNGQKCAIVGYDSGESAFQMKLSPMPNLQVNTIGRSHYWGDIYKSLETNWVQRVTMTESVISETKLPMPPDKINSVVERTIVIENENRDQ